MDTIEVLAATNESTLKNATLIQEKVLESVRSLTEQLKSDPPTAYAWLPVGSPATARELVEEAFSFNARLLDLNKSFAVSLVDVLTPAPAATKSTKK